MTTTVKHRLPRHKRSVPFSVWLNMAMGLGFTCGLLVLATAFALDLLGSEDHAHTKPAMPLVIAMPKAPDELAKPTPAAHVSPNPEPPPIESAKAQPVTVPEKEPDLEPMPPPAAPIKTPEPPRAVRSEKDLRLQLLQAPEFGLKSATRDGLVESYKKNYQSNAAMGKRPFFDPSILVSRLPSALQLPVRSFPGCQLNEGSAATLGVLSRKLHAYLDALAPRDANGKRRDPVRLRTALRHERRGKPPEWLRPEALPAMTQILMAEDVPLRLILVDMMADIKGKAATVRLAQRAVYDLSPEVRKAAIDALRERPVSEAQRTLVDAMRYPWPAAADNAATALVALGDILAAPLLVALLDKPDPAAPIATKTGASVREIVRVNHIENCLLCHVPAVGRDPVTDVDPFARRPSQTYRVGSYSGAQLPGSSGGVWADKVLIRADVQFLRQDFSITFPPGNDYSAAGGLRFDFLVRTRPLNSAELQEWKKQSTPIVRTYPQREAALYALRTVTGADAGPTTEAWMKLYPHAHAEAEGLRLSAALRHAPADQREQLLARYRDAKEDHYTEGLAHAIPHITGKLQEKVRTALVERLTRLSADQLRVHLDGEDELRRAAARACVRTADPGMIPELIDLLTDADAGIGTAAHQALQRLTGEDFGPSADCPQEEREAAAANWLAWHHNRSSRAAKLVD